VEEKLNALKVRLQEVRDIRAAAGVLSWDRSTYMPPGGAAARGQQLGTLARLAQEKATDPEIGRLLDALEPWAEGLDYDSDEAALVRVTRRDYDRSVRMPAELIAELSRHGTASYQAWTRARPANDFASVSPYLEKTLDLSRQVADCFPGYDHIADPLIDFSEYGMKAASVRQVFADLRAELVPLVQAVTERPLADDACLHAYYPEADQLAFGAAIVRQLGYDYERGRVDKTPHPFMTKFSLGDVRITTRVREDDLGDCLFSMMHEAGHAMYEQGINRAYEGLPLAGGTSSGVHESQSRLWENLVGRSRAFWEHAYPQLVAAFPTQLAGVSVDTFHRAINKVEQSLIRTDADELTYNLHVILRFDLELALLEGTLSVADLPAAWHARYASDLGVTAPNDTDGVLQDMHWFSGFVGGMFQGYTLGNILGAQFYDAALRAHPGIPAEIARGEVGTLRGWLTENVYRHGRKYTADELVQRATGGPMSSAPYLRYLRGKYGELYELS
jgi:carboxypeptidase Taq